MRAIAIENYGGVEQLKEIETAMPKVESNDILIEVYAAGVNPVDRVIREGYFKEFLKHQFPLILGWDVAGIVTAVGSDVNKFKVGDAVYTYPDLGRNGTYAEYVAVNQDFVSHKPTNLSFIEAASIPLVGITAWEVLVEEANLQPGEKVLILGGSGGVGSFAIQLAKAMGAIVTATTSTKNLEFVKNLGADDVIDYTKEELPVAEFDVVFDTVGGYQFSQIVDTTKKSGRILSIASMLSPASQQLVDEKGIDFRPITSEPNGKSLDQISALLSDEKIFPVVGHVFPLSDVKDAHLLSESKRAVGKIVLQVK